MFEIVRGHGFGAAELWIAFRRSRTVDWENCATEFQCFQYDWSTGTIHDNPKITEHLGADEGSRDWLAIEVVCKSSSDHATSVDGKERASSYAEKFPHLITEVLP